MTGNVILSPSLRSRVNHVLERSEGSAKDLDPSGALQDDKGAEDDKIFEVFFAEFLKSRPNLEVQMQGHCDERGRTEYNLALGEKRVRSVKEYLVRLGVNSNSLSVVSYGEEMPLDREQTEAAYAKNRRVEFAKLTK